ncbi:MAG: hypothetical protein AB2531_05135, partial [Candidatus Thiodiazotropha sp.]
MKKRVAANLLLIPFIGLLGLLLWWSQPDALPRLTELDPHQISRITINDLQGREIALARSQDRWMSGSQ